MYFPIGWPKELSIPELDQSCIHKVVCNRDKILFAILTDNTLYIWFCKPCVPIVFHQRKPETVKSIGRNALVEWRPDSSMLVVATEKGYLLFYKLGVIAEQKGLYEQVDSPNPNLRRDSAELFIKEVVPPLHLSLERETPVEGHISSVVCLRDELMIPSTCGHVFRYRWDGSLHRDYCLDLRRVPFCIDQQVSKAIPLQEEGTYVSDIEYSPLVGGFAIVLSDGRAAFLTAASLRFDPNQVQGIWAQNIDDATCASVNHKYRLIVFGRMNSQCVVLGVDDASGALEVSHRTVLASRDYVGLVGAVSCVRWTPDGCAMAVTWAHGGFSLWSTFGALLTCSLGWDYGLHVDLHRSNPLTCHSMEWSAEGYQLWMVNRQPVGESEASKSKDADANGNASASASICFKDSVLQLDFVKSALTVNPCMSHQGHLYLQGEDRLYVNLGESWGRVYQEGTTQPLQRGEAQNAGMLMGNKQWTVVQIPSAYLSTNWPIRYTAIDAEGQNVAVAGRTGLAHYSLTTRRWKLFGNESQEKDFVVTGGLLWWRSHVVLGCYSLVDHRDELRVYPRDSRLDNAFLQTVRLQEQVLLLNRLRDRFVIFCATGSVHVYSLRLAEGSPGTLSAQHLQIMDASALCVHPACVVSVALTALRTETGRGIAPRDATPESLMLNVSGRLLLVQRDGLVDGSRADTDLFQCAPPTALASCVENVWVPRKPRREKPHLTEALWLFCGAHGMRVWLPLFPRDAPDRAHTFMSKRIMLPFQLSIYPLAILFEDAILLGAENDTMLYTSDASSPFSLPFCVLEKTSQVYLHQILRQLIRRNLGFHAWEIARSCTGLPYFPHSLELLLHEVLEEEATSKEPIPDALLPSVIAFIQEFPVYLQTVVQCARKTEIALWPYLFSAAGKPKDLFQECLASQQLDTAASYLIILQNLEPSSVSRQYATLLLDASLDNCRWELSKDLVRFLRAIDPNDVESPRASFILPSKYGVNPQTPPVSPNEEDLSLVLGTMQVSRGRSFSTTASPKVPTPGEAGAVGSGTGGTSASTSSVGASINDGSKSVPLRRKKSMPTGRGDVREPSGSAEEFFIDVILQRHARRLLSARRLQDLGRFAAHLDFHLVAWLKRERDRAAQVDCFVSALKALHTDFEWPYPALQHPLAFYLQTKTTDGFPTSPSTEALSVDVAAGDSSLGVDSSGYRSSAGADPTSPHAKPLFMHPYGGPSMESPLDMRNTEPLVNAVVEAHLAPHLLQDEHSLLSEESSLWGDEQGESVASEAPSLRWQEQVPSTAVLEKLSQELSAKGSPRAEVQLRYLLQLFSEAGCMEWALVVSVLLRDAMAVLRTTTASRAPHFSTESLLRLRDGFLALAHWSASECLGYQPFMAAVQGQAALLAKAVAARQRLERQASVASTSPPSRPQPNTAPTAVSSSATANPTAATAPLTGPATPPSRSPAPIPAPAAVSRRTSAASGPSSRPASLGDDGGVSSQRRTSGSFGAGSDAVDSAGVSKDGGSGRHEGENEAEAGASGGCTVS